METVYPLVLISHIILMSLSLLLSTGLVATVLHNAQKNMLTAVKINYVATIAGIALGIGLLFTNPVPSTCLVLVSYVVAFQLLHKLIIIPKIQAATH